MVSIEKERMILDILKDEHNKDLSIHNIFMVKIGVLATISVSYYTGVISQIKIKNSDSDFVKFLIMITISCFVLSLYFLYEVFKLHSYKRIDISNLKIDKPIYTEGVTYRDTSLALISSYINSLESESNTRNKKNKNEVRYRNLMAISIISHIIYVFILNWG